MPDTMHDRGGIASASEARAELDAVLGSPTFVRSPRLGRLLQYLCCKCLDGEVDQIKEYSIAVEVLDRPPSFDPAQDASVRVEIHRLRKRLREYYEAEGAQNKYRIVIPQGRYVPVFAAREMGTTACSIPPALASPPDPGDRARPLDAEPRFASPAAGRRWRVAMLLGIGVAGMLVATLLWRNRAATPLRATGATMAAVTPVTLHAVVPPVSSPVAGIRLACGQLHAYTDRWGESWSADRYFEGGTAAENPHHFLARTFDGKLFQGARTGRFSYQIPLAPGTYELHLYFAETTYGPGTAAGGGENSRVFDVSANGRPLLTHFDILSDADGPFIADERAFKDITPDTDGFLHLRFTPRTQAALVNAIRVAPAEPHRLNPLRLTAQDTFFTDSRGQVWSPDNYWNGGQTSMHTSDCANTPDPELYMRERYGHFSYALPVAPGAYTLSLYFREPYYGPGNEGGGGVGSRVFSVFCNGEMLLRDFDLFREGGANRAIVRTFHGLAPNPQGKLLVDFVPRVDYASLFGIQVTDESR